MSFADKNLLSYYVYHINLNYVYLVMRVIYLYPPQGGITLEQMTRILSDNVHHWLETSADHNFILWKLQKYGFYFFQKTVLETVSQLLFVDHQAELEHTLQQAIYREQQLELTNRNLQRHLEQKTEEKEDREKEAVSYFSALEVNIQPVAVDHTVKKQTDYFIGPLCNLNAALQTAWPS